ncbi:TPA: ribose utilization transcriptional repressor RbsR [Staphylococcus aureus]
MKKVSIKDVAREAGVSVTTVSHILNHHDSRFSATTIKNVHAVSERLGYAPNKHAKQLRGSKIQTIGVILPSLTNPFFSALMQSIHDHKPSDVDLCFLTSTATDLYDNIKHLIDRGIDGLIIAQYISSPDALNNYLKKHHVPYVVLDQNDHQGYTDFVRTNEYQGGQLAAQHLIELGHNHMIIVAPYDMMANMSTRVAGFVDTLRANQLPEPQIVHTELPKRGGLTIVDDIMVQSATAIFAINDELAIGILRGLIEHGISIPKDISLIGYDDIDYAAYVSPPLTTVAQPITDIGKTSLTLLLQRLQHLDKSIDMIELPTTLKIRATTGYHLSN